MRLPSLVVTLAVVAVPASCHANIGETPEEVAARFDAPTATEFVIDDRLPTQRGTCYNGNKLGLTVYVYFEDGLSVCERYLKKEPVIFTADEVDVLLRQYGPSVTWTVAGSSDILTRYSATTMLGVDLTVTWFHGEARGFAIGTVKYEQERRKLIALARAAAAP